MLTLLFVTYLIAVNT